MIYQVTYELKNPDMDYSGLYAFLEHEMGTEGVHVLRDCWWVAFDEEPDLEGIVEHFRSFMGENDNFYFSKLDDQHINGWMPSRFWQWYREHK